MDLMKLIEFEQRAANVNTIYELGYLKRDFQDLKIPHYDYIMAILALKKINSVGIARDHIISAISYGLLSTNPYSDTPFADSIGQSIKLLFEIERNLNFETEYKLAALGYIYLSQMINSNGTEAYNSNFGRASFFSEHYNRPGFRKLITDYYYNGQDLCIQILTVGDYLSATIGFKEAKEKANEEIAKTKAIEQIEIIRAHPNYPLFKQLDTLQIIKLSKQNSDYLFEKLNEDFQNGEFDISNLNI